MNRQSFSKDPALAFGVAAKELANREVEANSLSHCAGYLDYPFEK